MWQIPSEPIIGVLIRRSICNRGALLQIDLIDTRHSVYIKTLLNYCKLEVSSCNIARVPFINKIVIERSPEEDGCTYKQLCQNMANTKKGDSVD